MKIVFCLFFFVAAFGCSKPSATNENHSTQSSQINVNAPDSKPLTDDDIEKYCAIVKESLPLQKNLKGEEFTQAQNKIIIKHGMTPTDYVFINLRINNAILFINMEKTNPIPEAKKSDVEIVRRNLDKIQSAVRAS